MNTRTDCSSSTLQAGLEDTVGFCTSLVELPFGWQYWRDFWGKKATFVGWAFLFFAFMESQSPAGTLGSAPWHVL